MKKRRLISIAVILGIGGLSAYWLSRHRDQPTYQGKPLSYWFRQNISRNNLEADKVLGTVGPEAVPYLRTVLRTEDTRLSRLRNAVWRKLASLAPATVRERLGSPVTAVRARVEAARILQRLGPGAGAAVPELADSLHHKEFVIRESAFDALTAIGRDSDRVIMVFVE